MELNEIINLIMNNGTALAILAYFVYRDNKFMQTLDTSLSELQQAVKTLNHLIEGKQYDK